VGGGLDGGGQRGGRDGHNGIGGGGGGDRGEEDLTQAALFRTNLQRDRRALGAPAPGITSRDESTATDAMSCMELLLFGVMERLDALRAAE